MTIEFVRQRRHETGKFADQVETYRVLQNRSGKYLLADPQFGKRKHWKIHRVEVDTREEAARLVAQGFSLWMKGDLTGQQNLISPERIEVKRGASA